MGDSPEISTDETVETTIVWFRNDLRLADNPALLAASRAAKYVIPLFIFDETSDGIRPLGGAARWWLHHALTDLSANLQDQYSAKLVLRRGPAFDVLSDVVKEVGASAVHWNRRYGPAEQAVDSQIKRSLTQSGVAATSHQGALLHEPAKVLTGNNGPYRVYTPFWKNLSAGPEPRAPLPRPQALPSPPGAVASDELESWKLLPTKPDWAGGLRESWTVGEDAAHQRADDFMQTALFDYGNARDVPSIDGTSAMSPYLRWGHISPYQLWDKCRRAARGRENSSTETYRKELVWREFSYHLLYHFPTIGTANHQQKFNHFPWRDSRENADELRAWEKGRTGYPIVDAGMRQLYHTGWMHNRVRMIVGSLLVKHLLFDWKEGEAWFWDTLVDADPASNSAGWQWIGGSGADAAPYFRVFNPITQGEKFDPDGHYVRKWVPELSQLPNKVIHQPWTASLVQLREAAVKLGDTYPRPIVEHKFGRERALDAFATLKNIVDDAAPKQTKPAKA
ncbi:MAG: deoxyribodipyrimidine photo-lyase [Pseudomonadota bacterium]